MAAVMCVARLALPLHGSRTARAAHNSGNRQQERVFWVFLPVSTRAFARVKLQLLEHPHDTRFVHLPLLMAQQSSCWNPLLTVYEPNGGYFTPP
jgi:hypothetical protein